MKLIYLTAKTYPSTTADHIFTREMALAFGNVLKGDFSLVVANDTSEELAGVNVINLHLRIKKGLSLFFSCWIPYFIFKNKLNAVDTAFSFVDPNLLCVLIFYKKIFRLKYKVVSDWHMLFEDWRDRYIAKNSTRLITTTLHLKSTISRQFNIDYKRILPAYGGVDMGIFTEIQDSSSELRTRLGLPKGSFIVGYVGFYKTMGMSKGIDTMIDALALLSDVDIKMVFVGGRPEEIQEYKKMAGSKGISDRAIFVPVVPSEAVPAYELATDILVVPYPDQPHFREYGFPMKVYEYMASGRPIVYSELPIISEVLGDLALPFKPGNARDLADKILYLKNNPIKGGILAHKAYAKVADYTWDKRAENIIAFL